MPRSFDHDLVAAGDLDHLALQHGSGRALAPNPVAASACLSTIRIPYPGWGTLNASNGGVAKSDFGRAFDPSWNNERLAPVESDRHLIEWQNFVPNTWARSQASKVVRANVVPDKRSKHMMGRPPVDPDPHEKGRASKREDQEGELRAQEGDER
jgi:hypothetical protein